jgi:tRNA A-37 threonylcarbamoyl transferase component Bud32
MASNDDLLFAEHCVKGGFVSEAQVRESLSVQERMAEMGVQESLRNVLVKRGLLREGDAALVARSAGLRSGREPIPGYTLQARLGAGAMGSVYRAHQRAMKRDVAIKILRRDLTDDPRQVERLQREATLVGKLDHPNIVRGLDYGESDGLVWFVMEYVEGRTIRQRIKADGPIPADEAVTITRKVAEALVHAHSHGVVHRDIKPGNILLTPEDEPRLTDYGLAKGESDDALTQLDATLGTPQYIAPEQARNPRDADVRSDIYGLGATLYTMLVGRPPYQAETLAATLTKVLYERPVPLPEAAPGVPPELTYVVERMMAKDRRHRYASPEELVRDLRALESGRLHVPAGFRGDIEEYVEARRQRRMWTAGVVLVAAVLCASVATWTWRVREESERRERAARDDLTAVMSHSGEPVEWDGGTVADMIRALEAHLAAHGEAATAAEARGALERWRRQEEAIRRVQALALRASDESSTAWPRLLADLRAELVRLERAQDADVARRRLRDLTAQVADARDRSAREAVRDVREEVAELSMAEAAERLESAADSIRDRFYGLGEAPEADSARALAEEFEQARRRLAAHFADFEVAAAAGALPDANLRDLDARLVAAVAAADGDGELQALLARLPPAGARAQALVDRHQREHARLVDASARRWADAQSVAAERVARREYVATEQWLDVVASGLLNPHRDEALTLRDRVSQQRLAEERELRTATAEAARDFLAAVGRRDYREAESTLAELEVFTAGWAKEGGAAERLVTEGRRLLALLDERAWTAVRARLVAARPLERGLSMGTGIRFQDVRDVRLQGTELSFSHGGGLRWQGGLYDLGLDDLLHYAGLPGRDPEGALVAAALHIAEPTGGLEPRRVIERMDGVSPLLERARSARDLSATVERLADRRREIVATAEQDLAALEARAARVHEEARRALDEGRYDDARSQLESLLSLQRLRRTDYVRSRRDEIQDELARAGRGLETSRYARLLPGARLKERPDGSAALEIDFEDEQADRAVATHPGRSAIAVRHAVAADHPGAAGDALPLVRNRMFVWEAWDGDAAHHPSQFPLSIEVPFLQRERMEIAFLYRSDAPFFLLVSCGGVNAGILSAPEVREGGRGVAIWQADSLEGADAHFSERHRAEYLARHPEVLRREGDTTFFAFEPGRVYRVRFLRLARRAQLYVDGRLLLDQDLRAFHADALRGKVLIASYTSGEIDDVRVTGVLDAAWLGRKR